MSTREAGRPVVAPDAPGIARATSAERSPPPRRPAPSLTSTLRVWARAAHRIRGEVRFDDGAARSTRPTPRTTARCRIGVVIPQAKEDVVAIVAACRASARRSSRAAAAPGSPARPERGRRHRLVEVHATGSWSSTPRAASRGSCRASSATTRATRRAAPPDVRAPAGDAQPLLLRRDARQQLVRHPRADGRQGRRQHRTTGDPASTTARA